MAETQQQEETRIDKEVTSAWQLWQAFFDHEATQYYNALNNVQAAINEVA